MPRCSETESWPYGIATLVRAFCMLYAHKQKNNNEYILIPKATYRVPVLRLWELIKAHNGMFRSCSAVS